MGQPHPGIVPGSPAVLRRGRGADLGALSARIGHDGADLQVAATALSHDGTVVTGNVSDFRPTGCRILDPFA
ncbi:hypothetical protein ACFSYD_25035 [Paracoccus aerius]